MAIRRPCIDCLLLTAMRGVLECSTSCCFLPPAPISRYIHTRPLHTSSIHAYAYTPPHTCIPHILLSSCIMTDGGHMDGKRAPPAVFARSAVHDPRHAVLPRDQGREQVDAGACIGRVLLTPSGTSSTFLFCFSLLSFFTRVPLSLNLSISQSLSLRLASTHLSLISLYAFLTSCNPSPSSLPLSHTHTHTHTHTPFCSGSAAVWQ